jgi:hypothetical protein
VTVGAAFKSRGREAVAEMGRKKQSSLRSPASLGGSANPLKPQQLEYDISDRQRGTGGAVLALEEKRNCSIGDNQTEEPGRNGHRRDDPGLVSVNEPQS